MKPRCHREAGPHCLLSDTLTAPLVLFSSRSGQRGAPHCRGDGRAAAAEHGVRVPVPPGGGQAVRSGRGGARNTGQEAGEVSQCLTPGALGFKLALEKKKWTVYRTIPSLQIGPNVTKKKHMKQMGPEVLQLREA